MKTQKSKINVSVIISLVLLAFVIGVEVFVIWINNQSLEDTLKYPPKNPDNSFISDDKPKLRGGFKSLKEQYTFDQQIWEYRMNNRVSFEYLTNKWKSMQMTAAIAAIIFMIHAVI
jgi:hypothetical protein